MHCGRKISEMDFESRNQIQAAAITTKTENTEMSRAGNNANPKIYYVPEMRYLSTEMDYRTVDQPVQNLRSITDDKDP